MCLSAMEEVGMNVSEVILSHLINVYGFFVRDTASYKKQQKASPFVPALPGQWVSGSEAVNQTSDIIL